VDGALVRFLPVQNLSKIFAAGTFVLALKSENDRWECPWLFNEYFNCRVGDSEMTSALNFYHLAVQEILHVLESQPGRSGISLSRFTIVDNAKFDLAAVLKGKRTKLPNELSRMYVFRSES
jgi:hypothetical protein